MRPLRVELLAGLGVEAHQHARFTTQVNEAVHHERRRNVRAVALEPPDLAGCARRDETGRIGSDADDCAALGRGYDNQVGSGHGRRDETQVRSVVLFRVQVTHAPDLRTVGQSMRDGIVIAVRDQIRVGSVMPQAGRRVGVFILRVAVAFARDFPGLFAGRRIEGDHEGASRVNQLQVQPVLIQERRGVHAVLRLEAAVAVLRIEFPDLISVEIETGQLAGADKREDMFAIGAGRGRRTVTLVAANRPVRAELLFPKLLAIGARADNDHIVAVLTRQKDVVAPDGGRRAAHTGHLQLPQDIRRLAPGCRQVCFMTDAVVIGSAPLGPILGVRRAGGLNVPAADRGQFVAGRRAARVPCLARPRPLLSRTTIRRTVSSRGTIHRTSETGAAATAAAPARALPQLLELFFLFISEQERDFFVDFFLQRAELLFLLAPEIQFVDHRGRQDLTRRRTTASAESAGAAKTESAGTARARSAEAGAAGATVGKAATRSAAI